MNESAFSVIRLYYLRNLDLLVNYKEVSSKFDRSKLLNSHNSNLTEISFLLMSKVAF